MKLSEISALRTGEQNDLMWSLLRDLSVQLKWSVNGYMDFIAPEDWKDILTAGLEKEQRVAQGISGGWVLLGQKTRKFKKEKMTEFIEMIFAFGAQHGIAWTHEPN